MTELTGTLIEMNSHMIMSKTGDFFMCIGVALIAASIISFIICFSMAKRKLVLAASMAIILAVGIASCLFGYKLPREKIIMACVNGPISIERISAAYDILEIDGKQLTLRVR